MLLIRRFEEKAGQLYGMGHIGGFCHLYIGQEAVVVLSHLVQLLPDLVVFGLEERRLRAEALRVLTMAVSVDRVVEFGLRFTAQIAVRASTHTTHMASVVNIIAGREVGEGTTEFVQAKRRQIMNFSVVRTYRSMQCMRS